MDGAELIMIVSPAHLHEKWVAAAAPHLTEDQVLSALVDRDPDVFYRPAYYHASGWVGIALNRPDCDWDQVQHWLERSWRSVAPKRLTKLMDAAEEF